jgi:type IV pilus assembly protein PilX
MSAGAQRGLALVTSLLLLLAVSILAVAMFRRSGVGEQIAGTTRDKHRALHAAETAQQYAEWYLSSGNATSPISCVAVLVVTSAGQGQVCQLKLTDLTQDVTQLPWQNAGTDVGVEYAPPGMLLNPTGGTGTYSAAPRFYISFLGPARGGKGAVYQIDAVGYGGRPDSVAIVESTYRVAPPALDLGGL